MSTHAEKIALITGASGGIGEAFAHILAADGYMPVLVARSEEGLNRVRGEVAAGGGKPCVVLPLDLGEPGATQRLQDELEARALAPDVVINNAGFGLTGPALQISAREQLGMIDLNVRCLTDLTLRFLPAMVAKRRGGVINLGSVAAFLPGPNMAVYFASKAYVVSFTDALHEELKGTGVNAMSLCPGPVETGFQARAGMKEARRMSSAATLTATQVAELGWAGFKRGDRQVIPGLANKLMAYATRGAPRTALLPFAGRAMARARA
jgi:hypothetical protein